MARNRGPAVNVSADLSQLQYFAGYAQGFTINRASSAYKREIEDATHAALARQFDQHIGALAEGREDNFHHVYEYSPAGNPYSLVGRQRAQLWRHTARRSSSAIIAGFVFTPALMPNPDYRQRRAYGDLKELGLADYRNLLRLSKNDGKGYVFHMKATLLEYGISRMVYPREGGKRLFVPTINGKVASTRKDSKGRRASTQRGFALLPSVLVTSQYPGNTTGAFTSVWAQFWTNVTAAQFEQVVGQEITRAEQKQLSSGFKVPRRRGRQITVLSNQAEKQLFDLGRQHAKEAVSRAAGQIRATATGDVHYSKWVDSVG